MVEGVVEFAVYVGFTDALSESTKNSNNSCVGKGVSSIERKISILVGMANGLSTAFVKIILFSPL